MIKKDTKLILTDLGILTSREITKEEAHSKEPDSVYYKDNKAYEWIEPDLTGEDMIITILAKQSRDIRSIRTICSFFLFISLLLIFLFILLPALR